MKRPAENEAAPIVQDRGGEMQTNGRGLHVDVSAAALFLQWTDPAASDFCFRTFPDLGNGTGRNYTGSLLQHAEALVADSAAGRGVFVVVNQGGHKAREITRVRAVFADLDGAPLAPVLACDLQAHMVVESSPGRFHAYWLCDGLPLAQFKPLQQAIAARFGSDASVCDLPRVMRLPGFIHVKGSPFMSRVLHWNAHPRFTAEQLLEAFPPTTRQQAPAVERADSEPIETGRHEDLLSLSRKLVLAGLQRGEAIATLKAMADAGRWSREMAPDEIARAVAGAVEHLTAGDWSPVVDPAEIFGHQPLPAEAGGVGVLRPVDLSDLAHAQVKPVRYVVQTLIPCAHLTLLGSHGGSGKTNLALTVAAHVAVGAPWAGFETEHRPVLFASLEDGGDIVRLRLRRICAAYGLDPAAVGRNIRLLDGSGSLSALMAETGAYSGRKIEETPTLIELRAAVGDAGLIVIDNASDAVDFNESDRRAVRVFVRTLAGLGHRNEAGVLLLAHIDKNAARYGSAGNSYSGSTGWHNSARSRLALLADRDGVQLVQEKANLGAKAEPVRLRWTDSGVLVPDDSGDGAEHASNADAVMAAIAAAIADGVTVSTGRTGPATTQKLLENFPDLPTHLRGPRGREAFWAAITDLQRAGKITAEDFQNSARKLRQRFVIAAAPIAPIAPVPTIGAIDQ